MKLQILSKRYVVIQRGAAETTEEIAEHEKLKARRAKKAEYNRRYMEKRRKRIAEEEQKSKEVTVNG